MKHTVKDAPSIEMVLPEFCGFIQDRILIGHNVAEYDNPILERDLKDYLKRGLPKSTLRYACHGAAALSTPAV